MLLINKLSFLIQYRYSFYIYLLIITVLLSAIVAILIIKHYRELKNAIGNGIDSFPRNHLQLNALLNSLNDIIFELNEDKVCLNIWFNENTDRVIDLRSLVGKKVADVLGSQKALKFDNAINYVIKTRKPTSIEFISDWGTGKWFLAKFTPVFDREGNYLSLITASIADISEQKQYAEALKQNERALNKA